MKRLRRKIEINQSKGNIFVRTPILKIAAFVLIAGLSWVGLSNVITTSSYFSDLEESNNDLVAGALDFELSSNQVFSNAILSPGSFATGTISIINLENVPKYKLKADNFSGGLCDYIDLEANLDGGDTEYSGKLTGIDYGPLIFESPDDWFFTLILPAETPEEVIGETCNFNFVFYGSQIKNDLPFGTGFTDDENADNNLKALMCFDSETRSKGYWKNHLDVVKPYLPQMLGNEMVSNTSEAYRALQTDYNLSMRNKLMGQLLAMKLNVAHFGVGDYVAVGATSSVNQIIAEADSLLRETPAPPDIILEEMKDLLESLAQDLQIRVCTETGVKVIIPNGGEQWWVGKYYDLTWITKNLGCPNGLAHINIWYSKDSGSTWGNIVIDTEDDGIYNWRIPLFLENNTYYTPSDKARIKVVAVCSENLMVAGWDISDYDFCPPIDQSLLTPEEMELAIALGLVEPPPVEETSVFADDPVIGQVAGTSTDTTITDTIFVNSDGFGQPLITPETPTNDESTSTIADATTTDATTTDATTTDATTTDVTSTTTDPVIPPGGPLIPPSETVDDNNINTDATTTDATTTDTTISEDATTTDATTTDPVIPPPEPSVPPEVAPFCGDSNVDDGEECDAGSQNGIECLPEYGSSCNYCSLECKDIMLQGSYCGDGIKNEEEECDGEDGISEHYVCDSFCALRYIPYCGDSTLDDGEECDMGDQNGVECIFELGSSCAYCSAECKNITLQDLSTILEE